MCGRRSEAVYIADMVSACERMLVFASGRQPDELPLRLATPRPAAPGR